VPLSNSSLSDLIDSGRLAWSVLQSLPDAAIIAFDRELVVVAAAGQPLSAHGFDPAQITGRSLRDVLPAPAFDRLLPYYRLALAGEISTHEAASQDQRGVFTTSFSPIHDGDGNVVGGIAVARDVTAEREAQAERAAREEHYRYLTEDASDVISRLAPDGTILYISPACKRLFGYEPGELIGRSGYELFVPEDRPDQDEADAVISESTEDLTSRYRVRCKDGSSVLVESIARPRQSADGAVLDLHVVTRDLRDREAAEAANRLFEAAFSEAPTGMAIVGLDGRWERVNESLSRITGFTEEELLQRGFAGITHADDLAASFAAIEQLRSGELARHTMEKRYRTKQGEEIWVSVSIALLRAPDGTPLRFVAQTKDISERRRMEKALRHLADHDPLTGLWNRRRFDEELTRQVARCQRYGERAALLVIDLDRFKPVNDTAGHRAGDTLLRAIGHTLGKRIRESDALARIGGDEFAILLHDVTSDEAGRLGRELTDAIAATEVTVGAHHVRVTASVGVGAIDAATVDADDAFVRADRAMYAQKPSGVRRERTS